MYATSSEVKHFGVFDEFADDTLPLLNGRVASGRRCLAGTENEALVAFEVDTELIVDVRRRAMAVWKIFLLGATVVETHCRDVLAREVNPTSGITRLVKVVVAQHSSRVDRYVTLIEEYEALLTQYTSDENLCLFGRLSFGLTAGCSRSLDWGIFFALFKWVTFLRRTKMS